jgi:hypothetical protein
MRAAALLFALVAGVAWLGCGRSEQGELERGLTVDREQAAPDSNRELEEPEAKRNKQLDKEEDQRSEQLFDEAERQD